MAGPDFSTIFSALQGTDKAAAEADPFEPISSFSDSMGQFFVKNANSSKDDLGELAIASLVSGLIGGAAKNRSADYRSTQRELAREMLPDLMAGNVFEPPENMAPQVFSSLNDFGQSLKMDRRMQIQQNSDDIARNLLLRKMTAADEREGRILSALATAQTPQQQQRILQVARGMGIVPEGFDLGPVGSPASGTAETEPESKGLFPGETYQEKRKKLLQEQLEMGLPGGAAQKEVDSQLQSFKDANKESTQAIIKAREKADLVRSIAERAKAGVQGAGQTGGFFAAPRDWLSSLYATVNDEERDQRTAQKALEEIGPDIVSMKKTPGPVTDYETRLWLGSGPSINNTPQENEMLISRMEVLGDIQKEYASFLETVQAEKGTTMPTRDFPGAETLWQEYKAKNPFFIFDKKGQMQLNPNRKSWREFDFSGVGAEEGSTGMGSAPPPGMKKQVNRKTGEVRWVPK